MEPAAAEEVDVEQVVDLADHHYRAGHRQQAYRWALLGAEAAKRQAGRRDAAAAAPGPDLHAEVPDADLTPIDLLDRIRTAAERAGEQEEELAAVEDLLAGLDRERQPLLAGELLVRRRYLRDATGRAFASLADATEAVDLSAGHPGSAEHALAVADLATVEMLNDLPSGRARADEAVDSRGLRVGQGADIRLVCAGSGTLGRRPRWYGCCRRGAGAGCGRGDTRLLGVHLGCDQSMRQPGRPAKSARHRVSAPQSRASDLARWAAHIHRAALRHRSVSGCSMLGDWRGCLERLRVVLGSTPGPGADTFARLTSALLACWQGRWTEAQAHLARAEELFAELPRNPFYAFAAVRAELAVAAGDTERAVALALAGVRVEAGAPTLVERLIPLAARAIADEAQNRRDRGDDPAPAVARLLDFTAPLPGRWSQRNKSARCTRPRSAPCRPSTKPRYCAANATRRRSSVGARRPSLRRGRASLGRVLCPVAGRANHAGRPLDP